LRNDIEWEVYTTAELHSICKFIQNTKTFQKRLLKLMDNMSKLIKKEAK